MVKSKSLGAVIDEVPKLRLFDALEDVHLALGHERHGRFGVFGERGAERIRTEIICRHLHRSDPVLVLVSVVVFVSVVAGLVHTLFQRAFFLVLLL